MPRRHHHRGLRTAKHDTLLEAGAVGLCVLNPSGLFFNRHVRYAEPEIVHGKVVHDPGTWHWPEFVAPKPKAEPRQSQADYPEASSE